MNRERVLALAVLLLTVMVFVTDGFLFPHYPIPSALYAVPILLAAYLLSPVLVAITSGFAIATYLLVRILQQASVVETVPYLTALLILSVLASVLANKIRREAELRGRAEDLTAEISRRAAELDTIVGAIGDGVVIFDAEGRAVRTNAEGAHMLGLDQRQLPLAEWDRFVRFRSPDGEVLSGESLPVCRALRGETTSGTMLAVARGDDVEERWVAMSAAPLTDHEGRLRGAVMSVTDITALHLLQEQQRDILQTVSHDLRTPLTAILGHAQILDQQGRRNGNGAVRAGSIEAIIDGAKRMNVMIQELVETARLSSREVEVSPEPLNLTEVVRGTIDRFASVMDVSRIRVESVASLPAVTADVYSLERVLANLLSNAVKYSGPDADVLVSFSAANGEVITSISDRGEGIVPEEMPLLFRRFGKTSSGRQQRDSVGLGLFIARRLVEAQGGRIWAESVPGEGSTFSFSLPDARQQTR